MSGMVIATNLLAMNAHKNLKGVGGSQAKASERLSSGYRLNRSADDAAGLAISEKMTAQIRGLQQAQRNTEDGINLIQTMDGGMDGIQEMMIRQRELIIQALNDTNEVTDKDKIQLEIDQLTAEIGMAAERTTFNNIPLLNVPQDNSAQEANIAGFAAAEANIAGFAAEEAGIAGFAAAGVAANAAAIMPFALTPAPTQTINLSTLKNGDTGSGWAFSNGTLLILDEPGEIFELTGAMAGNNRITVMDGATAEIILNNTTINTTTGAALDMRGAKVNLWLEGVNNLRSTGGVNAGIETTNGELTIDGTGTLFVHSSNKAGIGGGQVTASNDASGGTIIINGGTVKATATYGVGIGGGDHEDGTGSGLPAGMGADLIVNGGWVEATGGYATDKIAIGGGGSGGVYGGDGGSVTVTGGVLIANGNIGGGSSSIIGGSGEGADVTVLGGLLHVANGWIGGGGNFYGSVNGAPGSTTVIDGNLSIVNPGTNIKGGVENASGDTTYAVQVFLYDPVNGQQFQFPPYKGFTYNLGTETYTGTTDKDGRLYMYLPDGSEGINGTMTLNGTTYVGTLKTMNSDHMDYLVFAQNGVDPPDPPGTPWPPYPGTPNPNPNPGPPSPGPPNPSPPNPGPPNPNPGPDRPSDSSKFQGDLWIQCGANSEQGVFISRYDCRPEALFRDIFDPYKITIEIDGKPKEITLTKLLTDPWEEATASLIALDDAFNKVNCYRSKAGAQQNSLEFTVNSLAVSFTNLEDANSRIRDADMAKEMMNLTKANILQQAGVAMLTQANQAPQSVLELLKS